MFPSKKRNSIGSALRAFSQNVWFFPTILTVPLILLTALQISGSSIGSYYPSMYGATAKDPSMIAGSPRAIRSDEWLVSSQMVIAQSQNNYKRVNNNIGNGQDMSLIDAPYREWSILFKPQNLAFFVMPAENAFAFRWWAMGYLLVTSCYFFVLELFPKRKLLAVLIASFVGLTPMMFWWYAGGILLTVAYSFFIAQLVLRLLKAKTRINRLVLGFVLSYVFICFGLLLYPPFQIPCAIATATFIIGWVFYRYPDRNSLKKLLPLWPYVVMSIVIPVVVGYVYYQGRKEVISTLSSTVYPGKREVKSGFETNESADKLLIFSSFLSPDLQIDSKAAGGYISNQSEVSNFVFIAPFLILPSIYLIYLEKRQKNKINWLLIGINSIVLLLLARMYLPTPLLDKTIYKVMLLSIVPNSRLAIGLGLAGVFQILALVYSLEKLAIKKSPLRAMALFGSLSAFTAMWLVGVFTISHFPVFISSYSRLFVFVAWVATGIFFILKKKYHLGLVLLVVFSFFSVYRVHPFYRGFGPLSSSKLILTIKSYPDDDSWVVLDSLLYENFPIIAGKPSLNSVQYYPQNALWQELDKDNQYNSVYNRYAHVIFSSSTELEKPFHLVQSDVFMVRFDPCGDFLQRRAKYVLAVNQISRDCVVLKESIILPASQFFIYEIVPQ